MASLLNLKKPLISVLQNEFIPARISSNKLMIILHGRGDSLRPFRDFQNEIDMPEMNLLLVNAPRKYLDGFTWYGFPPRQGPGVLKARKLLTALFAELEAQGWQASDIYLFGFSQGSLVSCDFVMNYHKPIGGVIGVSGYVYFFPNWKKKLQESSFQTPWLITHGTEDDALPIEETRGHVKKLMGAGLPVEWAEYEKGHEICESLELPQIREWIRTTYSNNLTETPLVEPTVESPMSKDSTERTSTEGPSISFAHSPRFNR